MRRTLLSVAIASLALTGCGTTTTERGVSGAGIGAAAGAALGAVTGMSVAQGAIIGAVAGGATGALTKKDQVNLGEPAWKSNAGTAQPAPAPAAAYAPQTTAGNAQTVRDIQTILQRLGLYAGAVDGLYGPQTQAAIKSYQAQRGLVVDGIPSPALLSYMTQNGAG